jgi:protoporphyrinogen/coproporphyrinogen III oxidase
MQETPILGPISHFKQVDIVGAGIAGLVLGLHLKQANIPFAIYEKTAHIGGKIRTTNLEYGIAESAANAIYANQAVIDLLQQLNIAWIKATPKLKRLIWTSDGPIQSPLSLSIFFKLFFGLFKKIPQEKKLDEMSVAEFFSPWLGQKFVEEVISTGLQGIYADGADQILFSAMWPKFTHGKRYYQFIAHLFRMRKSNKSYGSISFKNGMGEFVQRLQTELKMQLHSNSEIKQINPNHLTIICTDAIDASILLKDTHAKLANALKEIDYRGVNTTTLFLKNKIQRLDGAFGILFSRKAKEQFKTYGILNNSEIFAHRSNAGLHSYTIISSPKEDLSDVKNDLIKIGITTVIEDHLTTKWTRAIPRYNLKHKKQLELISPQLPNNIGLFASYTNGVSLRHMINFAPVIADKIKRHYQVGQ